LLRSARNDDKTELETHPMMDKLMIVEGSL